MSEIIAIPLTTIALVRSPAHVSLAVAPGSVKLPWHSTVIGLLPSNAITGAVVGSCVTPAAQTATPPGLQTFAPRSSQDSTVTFTNTTGSTAVGVKLSISVPSAARNAE